MNEESEEESLEMEGTDWSGSSRSDSESSADSSASSSSLSSSGSDQSPPHTSKRFVRQQHLLDKVASLGSSPINVIQAIAAKALNFKLKKSAPLGKEKQDADKSARLMRQYRMMRATKMWDSATTSKDAEARDERKNKRLKENEAKVIAPSNLFSVLRYWMSKRENKSEEKASFEIDERLLHKKLRSLRRKPKDYSLSVETINLGRLQHLSLKNLGVNVIEVK